MLKLMIIRLFYLLYSFIVNNFPANIFRFGENDKEKTKCAYFSPRNVKGLWKRMRTMSLPSPCEGSSRGWLKETIPGLSAQRKEKVETGDIDAQGG